MGIRKSISLGVDKGVSSILWIKTSMEIDTELIEIDTVFVPPLMCMPVHNPPSLSLNS